VRFESAGRRRVKLVKTYTFRRGDYTVAVKHEVINQGARRSRRSCTCSWPATAIRPKASPASTSPSPARPCTPRRSKFQKIDFKDITKGSAAPRQGRQRRLGGDGAALLCFGLAGGHAGPREFRTAQVAANHFAIAMVMPLGEVAAGASKAHEATLFAGPQEEDKLAALAPGLELVKDYGWLTVLSKPLFWLLTKLHGMLANWGWAIVALVVLLKIAFYWLNASAYRSMAKMKAVAPKVTELRERYKDKPQEMQQQMMRIYREEKVNPLGGCLPILVQMPFFIALYWVLLSSVEMRNAPWVLWITDLSAKDPWFILPVLMTASSLFQVWLNPTPPDPMQAKLMWFMPLAFGFMFFFFPAGLVLYWLTNNILSIAQQWFINKQLGVLGK
jgi:YidC/Oxa1 family membrane protein insertase